LAESALLTKGGCLVVEKVLYRQSEKCSIDNFHKMLKINRKKSFQYLCR
jgi:hypothetical protein